MNLCGTDDACAGTDDVSLAEPQARPRITDRCVIAALMTHDACAFTDDARATSRFKLHVSCGTTDDDAIVVVRKNFFLTTTIADAIGNSYRKKIFSDYGFVVAYKFYFLYDIILIVRNK